MKQVFSAALCAVIALSLCAPLDAQLADSAWPMFHQNARHTGQSQYAGPSIPSLAWSYRTADNVSSSPAIGNEGRLCVGSYDNTIYCLNSAGGLAWSYRAADDVFSSPAIGSDGRIYAGTRLGDNTLYCLDSAGGLAWSYRVADDVYSSPALGSNGRIYIGSGDFTIYCLSSAGGRVWSYRTADNVSSSPAIGSDGRMYAGSNDDNLYCLNSAGGRVWSYTAGGGIYSYSSPAIGSDGMIYVGSYANTIYCLNSAGGLAWSYRTASDVTSSPALGSDGRMYVGASSPDKNIYCLEQVPTATPTPTPTAIPPIDLTANKTTFNTTDQIGVTADVAVISIPCYPFVRIIQPDGSTIYFVDGGKIYPSVTPFLGVRAGPITVQTAITNIPLLAMPFKGIPTGTYILEGGAVDATKTTSVNNLKYVGTVDRETLIVQ